MDRTTYEEILLFCSLREIPFSELLEGRLLVADNSDEMISQIQDKIENIIDIIDTKPRGAKNRLSKLLYEL